VGRLPSLFWLSIGWLMVALLATAILLTELYSRALDTSLQETLEFQVETLTDLTLLVSSTPKAPEVRVGDPRFERTASGWYWTIRDANNGRCSTSPRTYVGIVLPEVTATVRRQQLARRGADRPVRPPRSA
jgi:hypothetical protein